MGCVLLILTLDAIPLAPKVGISFGKIVSISDWPLSKRSFHWSVDDAKPSFTFASTLKLERFSSVSNSTKCF